MIGADFKHPDTPPQRRARPEGFKHPDKIPLEVEIEIWCHAHAYGLDEHGNCRKTTQRKIAKDFGVSQPTVHRILRKWGQIIQQMRLS